MTWTLAPARGVLPVVPFFPARGVLWGTALFRAGTFFDFVAIGESPLVGTDPGFRRNGVCPRSYCRRTAPGLLDRLSKKTGVCPRFPRNRGLSPVFSGAWLCGRRCGRIA